MEYVTTERASASVLIIGTIKPLSSSAVIPRFDERGDLLSTGIESTLDDIGCGTSNTDQWRNVESGDGSDGIVHRVVTDVTMFTVDYDSLSISQGSGSVRSSDVAHLKTSKSYDLGHTDTWNSHEGHQGFLTLLERIEHPKTGVLNLGGVGSGY